jgi:hypothetical protein
MLSYQLKCMMVQHTVLNVFYAGHGCWHRTESRQQHQRTVMALPLPSVAVRRAIAPIASLAFLGTATLQHAHTTRKHHCQQAPQR